MIARSVLILSCLAATAAHAQVRAELRGHVTDAHTARPIADARIEIVGRSDATRSVSDGSFSLRGLEPRSFVVRVRAVGYAMQDADVTLENGRVATLEVQMEETAARLATVVVDATRDAAGTTTFDRQTIEASGRRDLGELLQSAAGVVITQAGGPGSASHASIRGSGANEVLVLVDGAPLNSPITGEADLSRLSLDGVERVVVHPGAQSARYGGRAMAGVIEVTTRRPSRDVSMLARAGAWGEQTASATVGDTRPIGRMRGGALLTADYRTLRGDFDYDVPALRGGGIGRRMNSDVTSREVAGTVSLDGKSESSTLRGSWETLDRGIAGSIVQPSTTGREGQARESAGLDAAWKRAALAWTFSGDATHEYATYVDPTPPFGSSYDDTVSATGLTASSIVTIGRDALSASFGGEARGTSLSSQMLTPGAPRWQRVLGAFGGFRAGHQLDSSGTRVDVDAAARVDQSSLGGGSTVSPRLAGSISRGAVVGTVSIGSAYTPPSLADQFFHEGVLVRPNPGLQPERTRGDVEARVAMHDVNAGPASISLDAAAFRANVDGMILWLPDYRFVWSPSNNQVHRSGWEVGGSASLPAMIDVHGTLNHADVAYAGPVLSGQVAYRPRTTSNVTLGAGPHSARFEITNRYVGARRTVPGSALNSLDPYWLTDARLTSARSWRTWALDASLGIENLLNQPAAMLVDYPFPNRGWTMSLRVRHLDRGSLR